MAKRPQDTEVSQPARKRTKPADQGRNVGKPNPSTTDSTPSAARSPTKEPSSGMAQTDQSANKMDPVQDATATQTSQTLEKRTPDKAVNRTVATPTSTTAAQTVEQQPVDPQASRSGSSLSKNASSTTVSDDSQDRPSTPESWPPSPGRSPATVARGGCDLADLPDNELRALFDCIDYVLTNVLRRLVAFATKVDEKNRRYSLANVPSTARWGHSTRTEKFLCVDNEPITIWTLANIETTWFLDPDGNPHGRVNIGHRLPFEGDAKCADDLFLYANPPNMDTDDVRFSGRYMKRFQKGSNVPTILPFEAIFDATRRFKAKSEMKRLQPSRIGKRDIVLIESNFTRFKEGEAKKIRRWTKWKVGFELQAVSLLFEAPLGIELEPTAPVVDDGGDDM